jgi:hypothetical protein
MLKKKRDAIYLDTSILWQFTISLGHPLFSILLQIAKKWDFPVFIPEVAYKEWLYKKREEIESSLDRIKRNLENLRTKYSFDKIDLNSIYSQEIFDQAKITLDENLKNKQIEIIKAGEIDLNRLIEMAINKIRPFEEKGEKGFRDSIILFTILAHAKSQNSDCFFIADDGVYSHEDVFKIAEETGVTYLHFNSIEDFKDFTENMEKAITVRVKQKWLGELEEFLKSKKQQINDFIIEKGKFNLYTLNSLIPPSWTLEDVLMSIDKPPSYTVPNIKKIKNIELLEIKAPSLPVEFGKELMPIYFMAKLKFHVLVERMAPMSLDTKIGIGGIDYSMFEIGKDVQTSEEEIQGEFPVYATIKYEDGRYTELKLDQVGGSWPQFRKNV